MDIETLLGSKARLKLMKILLEEGPMYLTQLAIRAQISTSSARYHLQILLDEDIVNCKLLFGGFTVYRINKNHELVKKAQNLFI